MDGELDFTTQQALLDAGFCDAFKRFHSEYVASYPSPARAAGNPDPVTCRLDYIYLSRDLRRAPSTDGFCAKATPRRYPTIYRYT